MESREIWPVEKRKWSNGTVNGDIISSYHNALIAAEKQIETLQEENNKLIFEKRTLEILLKSSIDGMREEIEEKNELKEENNRLKGLLRDCWSSAECYGYQECYRERHRNSPFTIKKESFEEWLETKNIKL